MWDLCRVALVLLPLVCGQSAEEKAAQLWADEYNAEAQPIYTDSISASWDYNTNLTEHNLNVSLEKSAVQAAFDKEKGLEADLFNWQVFENTSLRREFSRITDIGYSVLSEDDYARYSELESNMTETYSTAKVCNKPGDDSGRCYPLDPDLTNIMALSQDWDELVWAWQGWRNESGRKMPANYEEFAGLLNQAADMNGYTDNGQYWRSWYEDPDFRTEVEAIWQALKPYYEQLHAYVRRKLMSRYPNGWFPSSGHIPAHILGNMWAQSWANLEPLVRPYPEKPGLDVTEELNKQGYNATMMFELADEFFVSLGMIPMPQPFWDYSMIVRPDDGREVVCHASAWDFYNRIDYRVKQCTEVTSQWLITTHHEMGHIEYDLQYQAQPIQLRTGANPGFHEAIGDTISLSVSTPTHMEAIGLLPEGGDDPEVDMNFLMLEALKKIAFIPFGYLIDQWRWDLFAGNFTRADYNSRWWDVRCLYQGITPPVFRESTDFDPGAKFHIPNNTPYIRYFVSYVLQYQFHKAMCDEAGWTGPLHRCDVYQSTAAGDLLSSMLRLGASRHWKDALELMTGSRDMDIAPLIDYFTPLMDWLADQNAGYPLGWTDQCPQGPVPAN